MCATIVKRSHKLIAVYSLIFMMLILVLAASFFFRDKVPFNGADSVSYIIPSAIYIRRYILNLLSGNYYLYDFVVGYGHNVIKALSWSGLGDPFSFILCLFPEEKILVAIIVHICVRLYFAGLSFILCYYKKLEDDSALLALAFSYLFTSFTVRLGLQFYTWLNALITFPMLITGIEINCTQSRKSLRLPFGVFFLSLSGFYFLYIELMFSALYAVAVSVLFDNRTTCKLVAIVKSLAKNLIGVICGLGMGMIILGPSIQAFFESPRSNSTKTMFWYGRLLDRLIEGIIGMIIPTRSFWGLSMPITILCLVIFALLNNKTQIYNKVIFIVALGAFYSQLIGSLLNGFSSPQNDRWSFIIIFFAINLVVDGLATKILINNKVISLVAIILSVSFIGNIYFTRNVRAFVIYGVIVLFVFWDLTMLKRKEEYPYRNFLILTVFNILITVNLINGTFTDLLGQSGANVMNSYMSYDDLDSIIKNDLSIGNEMKRMSRIDVKGLSRNINAGMIANVMSCSQYFSMCNKYAYDFYINYGLFGSNAMSGLQYYGLDQRSILLDYFAVSKYYNRETEKLEDKKEDISWGVLYDKIIEENDVEKLDPIQKMKLLSECAVVNSSELINPDYEVYDIAHSNDIEIVDFCVKKGNELVLPDIVSLDKGDVAYISLMDTPSINNESYLTISEIKYKDKFRSYLDIDGDWISIYGDYGYKNQKERQLVKRIDSNNNVIAITNLGNNDELEQQCELTDIKLVTFNEDESIKKLHSLQRLKNVSIGKGRVSGEIEGKGILVLPIFYDREWIGYVDGIKTEVFSVNSGLIALELDEGDHFIEIVYKSYSTLIFAGLTLFFTILMVGYTIWVMRRNRK